jgi:hypothetical protein
MPDRLHRRRRFAAWLALAAACPLAAAQQQLGSPQALLAASDAIRNPDHAFGLTNTLTEYRQGRLVDSSTLAIYSKADPQGGQFRSLVRYLAPARDAGKLVLYNGRDLWFFDPAAQASIRLSPQQRLLGQAANGDVVSVNFARDYEATSAAEEEVTDGDRRPRRCIRLALRAKTPDAAYHRIDMWVAAADQRPVKAQFLAETGRLLKTAYYRRYQPVFGVERPTETVIIDGLEPGWVTVMRYADWARREVPDAWLQREYLPRFRPE